MSKYQISNTLSGHTFGIYEGNDEADALETLARDAGHASYADMCEIAPSREGEILVREVSDYPPGLSGGSASQACDGPAEQAEQELAAIVEACKAHPQTLETRQLGAEAEALLTELLTHGRICEDAIDWPPAPWPLRVLT